MVKYVTIYVVMSVKCNKVIPADLVKHIGQH